MRRNRREVERGGKRKMEEASKRMVSTIQVTKGTVRPTVTWWGVVSRDS